MNAKILIIDNEPRWLNFAKKDLVDFDIVVAPDMASAVAEIETNGFDLVIASARYVDVLKILSEKHHDRQVVVTTIRPSVQEARNVYGLGARRYIAKSFKPNSLVDSVRELVTAP